MADRGQGSHSSYSGRLFSTCLFWTFCLFKHKETTLYKFHFMKKKINVTRVRIASFWKEAVLYMHKCIQVVRPLRNVTNVTDPRSFRCGACGCLYGILWQMWYEINIFPHGDQTPRPTHCPLPTQSCYRVLILQNQNI